MQPSTGEPGRKEKGRRLPPLLSLTGRTATSVWQYFAGKSAGHLLLCFFLPFGLMLGIYMFMQVYPFGSYTVMTLDMNGQYVYFFEALRSAVLGDGSLLYSFSRSLGGEFLGIYAYYLASPLSYLVVLFPKENITEALFLILLLKCGLSGLSFGFYLHKTTRVEKAPTLLFSAVYALTGYAVIMQHNTMWIDELILLPVIAVGLRALICERKYKLYTLSLALALLSNYYIGYMMCIFLVLYFLYLLCAMSREERNPRGQCLSVPRACVRFAVFSLIAAAMAAIILLPAAYSLTFGKNTFTTPTFSFTSKLDLFDILSMFLFGTYDTVRPEGLPIVYCTVFVLFLLPYYFLSKEIRPREKAAAAGICLLLFLSFSIVTLDLVWHGGQAPNWLNYRYSFMLDFLLVTMAAKGYGSLRDHRASAVILAALPLLCILLLSEHYGLRQYEKGFYPVLANIACIAVYIIALSLVVSRRDIHFSYCTRILSILVCAELLLGGLCNFAELTMDVGLAKRDSFYEYEARWESAVESVKKSEQAAFYRFEKLGDRKLNDPYMFTIRALSGSTSTLNRETIRFLSEMGQHGASHASRYTGTNPFTDSFLSISYVAGDQKTVFPASYTKVYDDGDVLVYRNPDALPIAFGVSSEVDGIVFHKPEKGKEEEETRAIHELASPYDRMNILASALLGEEVTIFRALSCTVSGENLRYSTTSYNYTPRDSSQRATASFTVTAGEDCELYAYFPLPYSSAYTKATYLLNGEEKGEYFEEGNLGYLCLGTYAAGERCTISFRFGKDGIKIRQGVSYFYALDRAAYRQVIDRLSASAYRVKTCTEDSFCGSITVAEGQTTILTTIPYDKGWEVYADGERVETYETLDALIAFRLPAGEHALTMRYRPKEYRIGLLLSLGGTGCFLLIAGTEYLIQRRKRKMATTAAGEDNTVCSIISKEN